MAYIFTENTQIITSRTKKGFNLEIKSSDEEQTIVLTESKVRCLISGWSPAWALALGPIRD